MRSASWPLPRVHPPTPAGQVPELAAQQETSDQRDSAPPGAVTAARGHLKEEPAGDAHVLCGRGGPDSCPELAGGGPRLQGPREEARRPRIPVSFHALTQGHVFKKSVQLNGDLSNPS